MQKPIFGVIGGAGVAASNFLCCMIEEKITKEGAYRDVHHPEIIVYQAVNVPSRSMFLEGRGPSFIPGYVEIGKKLKSAGATLLCMSCNTAHYAIDDLRKEIGLPIIDMVEQTIIEVATNFAQKKIGLVASEGCLLGKVYETRFIKHYPQFSIIYPDSITQKEVTRGIVNIKNLNRFKKEGHTDRPKTIFSKVCRKLIEEGAELIILGCTDITVDFSPNSIDGVPIVDSLRVLANSIIEEFKNSNLK